jgi:hypothetical protein
MKRTLGRKGLFAAVLAGLVGVAQAEETYMLPIAQYEQTRPALGLQGGYGKLAEIEVIGETHWRERSSYTTNSEGTTLTVIDGGTKLVFATYKHEGKPVGVKAFKIHNGQVEGGLEKQLTIAKK